MKHVIVASLAVLGANALTISKVAQQMSLETADEPAIRRVQKMIREYQQELAVDIDELNEQYNKDGNGEANQQRNQKVDRRGDTSHGCDR